MYRFQLNRLTIALCSFTTLIACETPVNYDKGQGSASEMTDSEGQQDLSKNNDDSSEENTENEDLGQEENEEGTGNNEECTYDEYSISMERAFYINDNPEEPMFIYQATNNGEYPMDVMEVLSYPGEPYNGPSGPGEFSLNGNNYRDCSLCLLIYKGCYEQTCEKTFFADAGSVQIGTDIDLGVDFAAMLNNVVFREVRVDPNSYESTPIQGGDTWCVDNLNLSAVPSTLQ